MESPFSRPLKKRVNSDAEWKMEARELPNQNGILYLVFEWRFCWNFPGIGISLCRGILQAWFPGFFIFQHLKEPSEFRFETIDEALMKIDEYGWGEPPYIDEVFQDVKNAGRKPLTENPEAAKEIFQNLHQKWGLLIGDPQARRSFWEEQLSGIDF